MNPVVVVGAGISGLCCARALTQRGVPCVVVEAADVIGGRLQQVSGFVEWKLDIGAEFVHGESSELTRLFEEIGMDLDYTFDIDPSNAGDVDPDRVLVYLGRERRLCRYFNSGDEDVEHVVRFLDELDGLHRVRGSAHLEQVRAGTASPVPRMTMLEYAVHSGIKARVLGVLDAVHTRTWAASLDHVDAVASSAELPEWDAGSKNFRPKRGYGPLVQHVAKGLNVRTGFRVVRVDDSAPCGTVVVESGAGERIKASHVVLTVPVTVLRDGDITFNPPLPPRKVDAFHNIGMETGMKVVLRVSEPFWPRGTTLIFSADTPPVSQVWFDSSANHNMSGSDYTVTAFVVGPVTEVASWSGLTVEERGQRFATILDTMFGTPGDPRPCSRRVTGCLSHDWTTSPFVRGAYSYPKAEGARLVLEETVRGHIHFAGEACDTAGAACVHGAIRSGMRAADRIIDASRYAKL